MSTDLKTRGSTSQIQQVMVIGAGVMGSGIAAHLANAGLSVLLIDQASPDVSKETSGKTSSNPRNILATAAMDRMIKADPAPFMSKTVVKRVTVGNIEDDLHRVQDCDWVIEVIVEKLEVKRALYAKLETFLKPSTLISSNTSTIPLHQLVAGRSTSFQQNFAITHFFNPPRYMRLLELVRGPQTSTETFERLKDVCDRVLGKGVVVCHDTPGFIGNRIGTFWLQTALTKAIELGVPIEEADALFGKPLGMPKTGIFGLMDLVGLDLMPLIGTSMRAHLPAQDLYVQNYQESPLLNKMLADGYTGRKGKGGFYRLTTLEGKKVKEAMDLTTGHYRPVHSMKLAVLQTLQTSKSKDLRPLMTGTDRSGQYVWQVLSEVLCYAASLVPEIADDIVSVDQALKLGYNWKQGPFELIDRLGPAWLADRRRAEGRSVPPLLDQVGSGTFYQVQDDQQTYFTTQSNYVLMPCPTGCLRLSDVKRSTKPLVKNTSASLWDLQDGVVCFEFHSKMNTLNPDIMALLRQTITLVEKNYKALVIYNDGTHFSAGANIGLALFAANIGMWPVIDTMVTEGQQTYQALKYAPFPVVSAPSGLALGGGCEILLHSDAIQAHAESYIGLVEVGVGLVPAWGGCRELTGRWAQAAQAQGRGGPMTVLSQVFETIALAKVAKSAAQAQELHFLQPTDGITMNRDRLLFDAKERALSLVDNYQPPAPWTYHLPGVSGQIALSMAVQNLVKTGKATAYDEEIAQQLAVILTGDQADITETLSEKDLGTLEIQAFLRLVRHPKTLARLEHMLETGKPLRN